MNYSSVSGCSSLITRLWRLPMSLFVLLAAVASASAQSTGTLTGSVTSASTHNALQSATVSIPALNRIELTDNTGRFVISGLPVGVVDVKVSYTGFSDISQRATVTAAGPNQVDIVMSSSDVLTMQAFTVESVKEGQALAMAEQRNADNIKTVTALDEWGNLPTMSVGELAMRLPGITFTVDEDDVVNNVSVRGMPSSYTRLNIDGMSSTGVGGDGRSATLHSFSGAMYEQIEIIAAQTPDKRADSLGGQINLKTRSPMAMSEKRRINYNIGMRVAPPWAERSQQRKDHPAHPIASLSYQERFDAFGGSRNLGIALNVSYTEAVNMIVNDNFFYQTITDPNATPAFNDYTTYSGQNDRFISGISLRADYKLSPRTTISLRLLYNSGSEPFYDRTKIDPLGNGTVATLTNGVPTGTGSIVPGFTPNRTEIRPTGVAGNSRMDLEMWRYSFVSKNPTGTVAVDHDFGRFKMDYAFRWSNTHWDSGAGREGQGGGLTMRADNIGFILDKSDVDGRVFTQTQGPSVYDVNSYRTNILFTKRSNVTDTNEVTGTINASYQLPTPVPVTLKTGLDSINRRVNARAVAPRRWNRVAVGGVAQALTGYSYMVQTRFEEKNGGQKIPTVDPTSVKDLSDTTKWTEDLVYASQQPFVGRRLMEEGVDSGYLMGTTKLGRLTFVGGARVEDVSVDTFTYAKYRATATTVEPDPFKRALLDYGAVTNEGKYTKIFPSYHLSYDITSNLKARAGWSMTYGRPSTAQLIPALVADDQAETLTAGQAGLKPQVARNIDFKLEYYMKTGSLTAGVFQKNISDYILNRVVGVVPSGLDNGFEGNYGGYKLTSPSNAGSAHVRGWEVDYRQRFPFLPGALRGLVFSANYTWLETTGKFTGVTDIAKNDVLGFIPRAGNARIFYTYRKFGASVGANYTGRFLSALGPISPALNRLYRKELTTLSAGLSYRLRPDATLSIDFNNLTQSGPEVYRFTESRIRQKYLGNMTVNVGVSGQF